MGYTKGISETVWVISRGVSGGYLWAYLGNGILEGHSERI